MNQEIPKGFCQCGCGERTNLAPKTSKNDKWIKGEPMRFIDGHSSRGKNHPMWKGGRQVLGTGYVKIFTADGYVWEHIMVCEKVLGKPLPPNAVPHHVNENRSDNRHENLVICQDKAYHNLLHRRMRALKACGHANWLKCGYCKQYDDPKNLSLQPQYSSQHHAKCSVNYGRERRNDLKNKGEANHG